MGKNRDHSKFPNAITVLDNGNVGIGITNPDNTYQGLTIYGTNPSLRLKGSATGSWNWIEYVTSAGVNNFSMGVSQSTPLFVIKAGAGLDNPDFVMTSNGSIGIGTVSPGSYQLGGKFVVAGSTSAFYFNESNNRIVLDGSGTNRDLSFYFRYSNSATIESDSYLKMVLSGSEKFRISSDGRIGIGTSAPSALLDVYNSSTSGWSVRAVVRDANFASFLGTYYFSSTGRPGVYAHNSALNAWSTLYVNTLDGSASNGGQVILSSKTSVGATDHASNSSALDVSGAVRYGFARRSIAGWWSGTVPDASGTRYFHLKTNMWAGGGGQGNTDYTMSLFKGLFYSYSTKIVREGAVGFHNWSGSIYEIATVGNLWANVYASSDGYVVIVADVSNSSYGGLVIDWHQNYGYPFRDRNVTATGLHTSASGLY